MRIDPRGKRDLGINGYVLAQVPNPPLVVALLALVVSWLLAEGTSAYLLARSVLYMGLTVWAYLEFAEGVNGFRWLLGAAALVWIAFSLKSDL
ncbi:MAG: hypothetical protein KDB54_05520 [Solirubrobacterales bacterium]|nr:hypothetical protein [Solirubrobacterales bacterium]MCB0860098.1 hypothetical protein [Solirubrobacterales bacterium]